MTAERDATVEEERAHVDPEAAEVDEAVGVSVAGLDLGGELREAADAELGRADVDAQGGEPVGDGGDGGGFGNRDRVGVSDGNGVRDRDESESEPETESETEFEPETDSEPESDAAGSDSGWTAASGSEIESESGPGFELGSAPERVLESGDSSD